MRIKLINKCCLTGYLKDYILDVLKNNISCKKMLHSSFNTMTTFGASEKNPLNHIQDRTLKVNLFLQTVRSPNFFNP